MSAEAPPKMVQRAAGPLRGSVRVPGSKSVTNRALVLAALAGGKSELTGALDSEDTSRLSIALKQLREQANGQGTQLRGGVTLDCGDGGTPARFLMAVAALADGPVVIDGSARLRERPMGDGADLLAALGVQCRWLGAQGCLPVEVHARRVPTGGNLEVGRTASSQFVSALLLIAPWLRDGLQLRFTETPTSASYIDLTLGELRKWGAKVSAKRDAHSALTHVTVAHGPLAPRAANIEVDASSAVYWAAAAAIVPGSELTIEGLSLGSAQPDTGAIRALQSMGAVISDSGDSLRVSCAVHTAQPPLRGIEINAEGFPDGALAVIAASAVASTPSKFTGLGTLRVKESDRIAAMAHNLTALSARCETGADWIAVHPVAAPASTVQLPTFNDHRIAMSFAVLGLRLGGIAIENSACVGKSYPGFWAQLEQLQQLSASASKHP